MLRKLAAHGPALKQETLDQPIQIIQADGFRILVGRVAHVDTFLETEAGPAKLGKVSLSACYRAKATS